MPTSTRQIILRDGSIFIVEDDKEDIPFPPPAPHYVMVTGTQDSCFVGPFPSYKAANEWRNEPSHSGWDAEIMDIEEVTTNVLQFGDCPLQTTDEFDFDLLQAYTDADFCPECNSHTSEPHSLHCSIGAKEDGRS